MSVRARGTEVERVTWGLGKGERSQAGEGGLYAGPAFPPAKGTRSFTEGHRSGMLIRWAQHNID